MDRSRYDALMEVVKSRMTVRAFDPSFSVPQEHYEMILEAARHSPSGANAQPWHFIVVTDAQLKTRIMEYFREEQVLRVLPVHAIELGAVVQHRERPHPAEVARHHDHAGRGGEPAVIGGRKLHLQLGACHLLFAEVLHDACLQLRIGDDDDVKKLARVRE